MLIDCSIYSLSQADVSGSGQLASGRTLPPEGKLTVRPGVSWWRVADFGVLGLWMALVGCTIQYHEKWADEAQAWLIARDLDLPTIWFRELRYEGSPGLWHTILWFAQRAFHASYNSISYIGMSFAAAGVALLIFKSPFPRILRWLLPFTYFLVYQYAVIARSYTLLPVLSFTAAILFKDLRRPGQMTIVLILLATLCLHGTIIAGCVGIAYLIEATKSWPDLGPSIRKRYLVCVGAMALTLLGLFVVLKPAPDVAEFAQQAKLAQLPQSLRAMQPTRITKLSAVLSGAFMDEPIVSGIFLTLSTAWCILRRKWLTFVLPVATLMIFYVTVHGYAQHQGTVFIAAVTGLWIAWPTPAEQKSSSSFAMLSTKGMVALLVCLCAVNLWDAAVAVHNEYLYPYSGAEDAANFLKREGADKRGIFGYAYGMAGVEAYFDHKIEENRQTTYYHHGVEADDRFLNSAELRTWAPEYIVVFSEDPNNTMNLIGPNMDAIGYQLVHVSDGYQLYKRGVYVRQVYLIFRRVNP